MCKDGKCNISSRKWMVYVVMFLWLAFGTFVSFYVPKDSKGVAQPKTTLTNMAIYFVSLTGFVGSFIYGDTVKTKDWTTPLFMKGPNDTRETIVYISIALWLLAGLYGIVFCVGLDQIGAYFGSLTPFVAGYILGETQRSSSPTQIAASYSPMSGSTASVLITGTTISSLTASTNSITTNDGAGNSDDNDLNENSK